MLIQIILMIRHVVINVHLELMIMISNVLMMIQMEHVQMICI